LDEYSSLQTTLKVKSLLSRIYKDFIDCPAMRLREPAYAVLSALFGMLTLILAMLTVFFVFAAIRGALNQTVPQDASKFAAVLICFVIATASGLLAAVCGRFEYNWQL
jgi:hypothetical protein